MLSIGKEEKLEKLWKKTGGFGTMKRNGPGYGCERSNGKCVTVEKENSGNKLKLALVQARAAAGDVEANMRRGLEYVRAAKREGADLVLFPECWLTGYHFPPSTPGIPPEELERDELFRVWARAALTAEDPAIRAFRSLAQELSIGVVLTSLTQGRRRPRNSALVIGRDGDIRMRYDKVHTCSFGDERCLECGEGFRVCRFDGVTLGVMICYDREYPESARELALQGAEVILVPNDCGDMAPRLMELKVRAMENMAAVAMANPPGPGMGRSCAFHPMVWDAPDQTLALAGEHGEGLVMAEIDLAALRAYREREDLGKYRRPAAYRHWGGEEVRRDQR